MQTALFGSSPCLIVGSSLADDDAVAQLVAAHRQRPSWFSYVVLMVPAWIACDGREPDGAALDAIATPYRELGLHVLWIHSHDEIPELLDAISQPPAGWTAPDLGVRLPLDLIRKPDTPAAAVTLGLILARLRDVVGAEAAFARARASTDADAIAAATRNLAVLRLEHGDLAGGRAALAQTIALDHADQSPRAMVDLGLLSFRLGDRAGGLAALEQAIRSGHPEWVQRAAAERAAPGERPGSRQPCKRFPVPLWTHVVQRRDVFIYPVDDPRTYPYTSPGAWVCDSCSRGKVKSRGPTKQVRATPTPLPLPSVAARVLTFVAHRDREASLSKTPQCGIHTVSA